MPLPADFEKSLWAAADQLWTNSGLQPSEYSTPVLALIFLKYADHNFSEAERDIAAKPRRRGAITPSAGDGATRASIPVFSIRN